MINNIIILTWASRAGLSGVCSLPTFLYIVVFLFGGGRRASPKPPKASPKPPEASPKHPRSLPKHPQSIPKAFQSLPKASPAYPKPPEPQKPNKKRTFPPGGIPKKANIEIASYSSVLRLRNRVAKHPNRLPPKNGKLADPTRLKYRLFVGTREDE